MRREPGAAQGGVEEFLRGRLVPRQSAREIGRAPAVMGVDVAYQRLRRTEPGLGCKRAKAGKERYDNRNSPFHRRLALLEGGLIIIGTWI